IKEITCKTALSKSGLEADYALNPYKGCSHNCRYCYAPFVLREEREWGTFVDIKRNIPNALAKELKSKKKGVVRVGSVTDPYQPVEKDYMLTRMCLEQLKKYDYHILIQTKSDLVTRDIDILKDMDADVGLTITSLDDEFKRTFEPGSPDVEKRLSALEKLVEEGVNTWVFIGPLIPYKNDDKESLEEIASRLGEIGVNEIYLDKLNMRKGIWPKFEEVLDESILEKYHKVFSGEIEYFNERKEMYKKIGKTVF
ncbi:MAG: radical SAM protein, partial [Thermoplasmata archaeon]